MTIPATIDEFISDPALLGPYFEGASWDRWRAVLRAAYALPMSRRDRRLFSEVAGDRKPPQRRVSEFVALVGRGGGKDAVAAALAAHIAVTTDFSRLRPGERGSIVCIAVDRDQAAIAFSYIRGLFERVPLLAGLVERVTADTVTLSNGAEIVVGTNSYRAVRGRTIVCAIYDEVCFWAAAGAAPDVEVDAAVGPGMARWPGALKIMISSVYRRAGIAYERWRAAFGVDDPDTLVVLGSTLQFNSGFDAALVERQIARDPERYSAEYLSVWRDDLSGFLDRELIDAAVDAGVVVRPPVLGVEYRAFTDPSGGRGSSFAVAIAHAEGDLAVVDCLYERRAPFDPSVVVGDIATLLRTYGVNQVTGDKYAAGWVSEAFARDGISYRPSDRDRSAIYHDALPTFTAGLARLIDDERLTAQFVALERRTTRTGRDRIGPPADGADDAANAVAGALVLVATDGVPTLVRRDDLVRDGAALDPWLLTKVHAVLWVTLYGTAAVVYAGHRVVTDDMVVLDFDEISMRGPALDGIAKRLDELAEAATARWRGDKPIGTWLFVPPDWTDQAEAAMYAAFAPRARRADAPLRVVGSGPIPPGLLADPVRLMYSANVHTTSGRVQFAEAALEKAERQPLFGALQWSPGRERVEENPLRMGALLSVALAFNPEASTAIPAWPGREAA